MDEWPALNAIGQRMRGGAPNMPLTPPTFAERLYAFGNQQPGNIQDMRDMPQSGYEHMLAGNLLVRAVWRELFGAKAFSDIPVSYARKPTGGTLQKELGVDDIKQRSPLTDLGT